MNTNRTTNKKKTRRTRRNATKPRDDAFWQAFYSAPLYHSSLKRASVIPPTQHHTLSFRKTGALINGAQDYMLVEFKPNDVYDPEGALTGFQAAGFNWIMGAYNYGVVKRFRMDVTVNNLETDFSVMAYVTLKDGQPSSAINDRDSAEAVSNSAGTTKAVFIPPSNTMPVKIHVPWTDIRTVLGSGVALGGQGFTFAANVSPAQIIWADLVVYSQEAALFFGLGVSYDVQIECDVTFYSARTEVL
jgi:hypothetical protein